MRIMYVINSFGAGGAERHLLALVNHMIRCGHSVQVVALTRCTTGGAKDMADEFVAAGATVVTLDYAGAKIFRDFGRWFKLVRLVRTQLPEIIHSHLPRADFAASIAKVLAPKVIWISTIHDAYIKGVYSGHWIFPWLGWNWRRANHIVAVSGHARRWALEAFRLPEGRISVIYHGISGVPTVEVRDDIRGRHQSRVIGCLARFEPRKGIATLVRAMVGVCTRFPSARLILAGSDPSGYAKEMKELADSLKIGHAVEIRGFCNTPFDFLRSLDVFAFASASEGFGIVLLEAMSVGLPIVASDIYPINHIVVDERTGLLANPNDPEAFASAIISLLEDPERAHVMGEAGRRRCTEEFSDKRMTESTVSLYLDLFANETLKAG